MAETSAICLLMLKLEAILNDKEVNNPRLRSQVRSAKKKLEDMLKKVEAKQMIDVAKLLQHVYFAEDMIDTFFIKTELRRRKMFAKIRPLTQLMSMQSQSLTKSMKLFTQEIDNVCKVEDKQEQSVNKNDGSSDRDTVTSSISNEQPLDTAKPASEKPLEHHDISNEQDAARPASDKQPKHPVETSISSGQPAHPEEQSASHDQPAHASKTNVAGVRPKISEEQRIQDVKPSTSEDKQASQLMSVISDHLDDESYFIGREDEVEKLDQAILDRHKLQFLIAVVGAAGSGKTNFVRNIYNKANVVKHFQLRAWVNVSEELPESSTIDDEQKMKNLFIDILKQVTTIKEEEKLPLDKLKEKVRDFFIRKRFLIILDDVKTSATCEKLKTTFPNSLNGSRLILITRDENIATVINDPGFLLLKLPKLRDEDSWKLFLKKVPKTEESLIDPSLKNQILEKCEGLPLAIVVLGGLLSTKDPADWWKVVERLTFGYDPSEAILALAYEDLPSALKPCLLYLGLFPKEYVIPVRRLFRLWAAEGLANSSSEGETPEVLVESYLKQLITRNMIEVARRGLDGSPKKCRVPGILYDNVFPDATDIGFFTVVRDTSNKQPYIRRVAAYVDISAYVDKSNPPFYPCNENLRSYISFNTRKGDTPADEIDKFLNKIIAKKSFGLLTVLDLEHVYKPVLSDQAIGKLIHLSYLGLRWTFLDSIPSSVGDLPNLETLDVKHTNINSLPITIWSSKKLRHLYMNEIYLDVSVQKSMGSSSLENLLTLWGLVIGQKSPGKDWFNRLFGLMKLGLTSHFKSLEEITPCISKCTKLRSLKLRSIDEFSRPSELKLGTMNELDLLSELYLLGKLSQDLQLPKDLKVLTLSVSNLKEDPMQSLGKLLQLKVLRLFAHSYVGKEMTCEVKGFPQLRVLKLWMLEELEKWTVQEGSMPCLKELEIRRCEKLKEISGQEHLSTLKELTLTNMPDVFVVDIQRRAKGVQGRNVTITVNDWDFYPLPESFQSSMEKGYTRGNQMDNGKEMLNKKL